MIPITEPCLNDEELKNVTEAISSGWISSKGKFVEDFEKGFSKFIGCNHGVSTSNGTVALHLALKALGIGNGDEVIIPDLTFIATANSVTYCNAKPVLVDISPEYWCIDPNKIEEKITKKTKAIIPVHLYGHPCDMTPILDIAQEKNLFIIEDVAEAHGAEYKGKKVGSFADISCFSFYGNKIITTGEGGMCLTDNDELFERMKILRDHGMNREKKYWHDFVGYNYRMTNIQAAIGLAQLNKIERFIDKKIRIAKWYLSGLNNLIKERKIKAHPQMPWAKCVYWLYSILIEDNFQRKRDEIIEILYKKGIETRPLFYPIHILPPYKNNDANLKNSFEISRKGLSLPSGVNLKENDTDFIIKTIYEI